MRFCGKIKALLFKAVLKEPLYSFCRISLIPVSRSDPETDLAGSTRIVKMKNDADQLIRFLQADCEQLVPVQIRSKVVVPEVFCILTHKRLQHLLIVRDVIEVGLFVRFPNGIYDQSFCFHHESIIPKSVTLSQ